MKTTDKDSYINEKTITKKFCGNRSFEECFKYIDDKSNGDWLESHYMLLVLGQMVGRFDYKNKLADKKIDLNFCKDYYIAWYDDLGLMCGSAGWAIVDLKTEEIVEIEILWRA